MKTSSRILLGVAAVTLAGVIIYYVNSKQHRKTYMLAQVADEGYETAEDILFPLKSRRRLWRSSY
ncbi:hypothetical protein EXU57_10105 [Segetibacter sp. 3557_3]|uniref:hypothetical protein n=1 Tax=Segetibacter sp. 3557_3 TaxID=2547429 RepID=UPI0010586AE5|nr:hypothetical protein [Segetibacter sp. 3557_3]TDH26440.1 hypothetical protein EXU57_10105 [Segetibacter sp. 3557_3]